MWIPSKDVRVHDRHVVDTVYDCDCWLTEKSWIVLAGVLPDVRRHVVAVVVVVVVVGGGRVVVVPY